MKAARILVVSLALTGGAGICQAPEAPKPVHFLLYKDQALAGEANYTFSVDKTGSKDLNIKMTFSQNVTVTLDAKYDSKNVWKIKTLDAVAGSKAVHLEAINAGTGAQIELPGPNGPVKKVLEPPPDLSIADPTLSWWRGVIPEKGKTYSFAYFDLERQAWVKETAVYSGDVTKTVQGTDYQTHEITETAGGGTPSKQYVDDHGVPVIIDGMPRFERSSAKAAAGS